MELLDGATLRSRLKKSAMSSHEARSIAAQLARGLAAAHAVGIVHRDFKSENVILVDNDGETRAVITDFGVAVRTTDAATASGMVGTPAYIAPELIDGGDATAAADLYSFGVVLYEMLSGKLPFVGTTAVATALARLHGPPPPLSVVVPAIDPVLISIVEACLMLDPEARSDAATPLLRALMRDDATAHAIAAAPPRHSRRWLAAGGVVIALGAAVLALLARTIATRPSASGPPTHRITHRTIVRPFVESTSNRIDEGNAAAGFGLRELLRAELSDAPQWRTLAPFDESGFEGDMLRSATQLDPSSAAHFAAVGFADYLVEGTFGSASDGQLDATARLVDGKNGELMASAHAVGPDVRAVASKLGGQLRKALDLTRHTAVSPGLWPKPADEREYALALLMIHRHDIAGALTHHDSVNAAEPEFSQASWLHSVASSEAGQLTNRLRTLDFSSLPVDDAQTAVVSMDFVNEKYASSTSHARDRLAGDPFDPLLRLAAIEFESSPTTKMLADLESLRQSVRVEQYPQIDSVEIELRNRRGDHLGALAAVARCTADATALSDRGAFARCNLFGADAATSLFKWDDTIRLASLAYDASVSTGDRIMITRARDIIWDVLRKRGRFAELERHARDAAAAERARHDEPSAREAEMTVGSALMEDGHVAEARELLGEDVNYFLANDNLKSGSYAELQAAQAQLRSGDTVAAQHEVLTSLGYYHAQQNDRLIAYANSIMAELLLARGTIAEARAKALDALQAREKGGWSRIASQTKFLLAKIDIADGKSARADASLRELLADRAAALLPGDRIEALGVRALALVDENLSADALRLIEEANALIVDDDSEPLALLLGRAHALATLATARNAALAELLTMRQRAESGGYVVTTLELRLAIARAEWHASKVARFANELDEIAATADKLGLGLVAAQARAR